MGYIQHSSVIQAPLDKVFEYISDYGNRVEILPRENLTLELLSPIVPMKKGIEFQIQVNRLGFHFPLTYLIEDFKENEYFIERQVGGIFEDWTHTYKFEKHGENSTLVTNIIEFRLPLGILGTLADDLFIKSDLKNILEKCHLNIQSHFKT